jgi:hypothetical protein
MIRVWVIYDPGEDCQCWRDSLCSHGWTWQEDEGEGHRHLDFIPEYVYQSLGDAVRELFWIDGADKVGHLLRERYHLARPRGTHRVWVMAPGSSLEDDHESASPGRAIAVIESYGLLAPSRLGDTAGHRAFANQYRGP